MVARTARVVGVDDRHDELLGADVVNRGTHPRSPLRRQRGLLASEGPHRHGHLERDGTAESVLVDNTPGCIGGGITPGISHVRVDDVTSAEPAQHVVITLHGCPELCEDIAAAGQRVDIAADGADPDTFVGEPVDQRLIDADE